MSELNHYLDEKWVEYREDHWKEGLTFYVSDHGRVKKKDQKGNWYLMRTHIVNGFPAIRICYQKMKAATYYLHRLVASAFIPNENPSELTSVCHLDFVKDNNHVSNLKWITKHQQQKRAVQSPNYVGKKFFNSHNHTPEQIKLIKKKLLNPNRTAKVSTIAKQFGYSEKQARRIMRGESWAEITID